MMNQLRIYRGIPGSGKSTLARHWTEEQFIFEADKYPERYLPDGMLNPYVTHTEAHAFCFFSTRFAMLVTGAERIAVANTFILKRQVVPYINAALEFGYDVEVIDCYGGWGSVHNVPAEVMERMRQQFQPWYKRILEDVA